MIGLAFTNGSPYVAATRSASQVMSTLPLALAVPARNGIEFFYVHSVILYTCEIIYEFRGSVGEYQEWVEGESRI